MVDELVTFSDGVTQDSVNILGIISAILFPFAPEAPLGIRLLYLTNIITSRSQIEQRICVRPTPVVEINATYKTSESESQSMENLLFRHHGTSWVFPLWYSQTFLSANASVDDLTLMIDTTKLILTDDLLIWDDYDRFEIVTVDSSTDSSVTINQGLINNWTTSSFVFPLVEAYSFSNVDRNSRTAQSLLDSLSLIHISEPTRPY